MGYHSVSETKGRPKEREMNGSCLCGEVRFEVKGTPSGISNCHCTQCRKQSGHVWASAYVADDKLMITGPVRWYQSSSKAKRGFCAQCGSFLFWKSAEDNHTSFALGALEDGHGLSLQKHIFTSEKGAYYEITDGLPQF
jgi:hypothetical protein